MSRSDIKFTACTALIAVVGSAALLFVVLFL